MLNKPKEFVPNNQIIFHQICYILKENSITLFLISALCIIISLNKQNKHDKAENLSYPSTEQVASKLCVYRKNICLTCDTNSTMTVFGLYFTLNFFFFTLNRKT